MNHCVISESQRYFGAAIGKGKQAAKTVQWHQSSMAALKEVTLVFPMVALNDTSTRLAVGNAIAEINNASIWVYNIQRNMLAKRILFYPRKHDVLVTGDGCPSPVALFSGRPGLYIEGSVSPPLSGVHIRIIAAGDSQIWLM